MIKLIKTDGRRCLYWETWADDDRVIVHFGQVGSKGSTETHRPHAAKRDWLQDALANQMRAQGYRDVAADDLTDYLIQYRLDGWGSEEDLNKGHRIEDLLNNALGWTGNGKCDGGDIGSGTMNIFRFVLDVDAATRTIKATLAESGDLDGAVLAYEVDDEYVSVHPERGAVVTLL